VTDFGVFVVLDNGVEGMIRLEALRDDHYRYDPEGLALVGQRSKRRIRIGDELEVTIVAANPAARQIDMEPVRSISAKPAKTPEVGPGKEKAARSAVGPPAKRERPDRGAKVTLSRIYFGEWGGAQAPENPSRPPRRKRRR
jgi:ribonuclease R